MNPEISKRISFLGFFMTCMVVLYHCGPSPAPPLSEFDQVCFDHITNTFVSLATLAMSYFFTVTGFLLFQNLSIRNWKDKIKRRVFSLLVPYLVWQFATYLINILHHEEMSHRDFLETVFLMKQWPPDGALWYLYGIFLLALFSPIILLLYEHANALWSFWGTFAFILFLCWFKAFPLASSVCSYGYIGNILQYIPSYLLGAYFGCYFAKGSEKNCLRYILAALLTAYVADTFISGFFLTISLQLLPILLLYLLPIPNSICNRKVYHLSFLVYALHQPLLKHFLHPIRDLIYVVQPTASASVINGLGRVLYLLFILLFAWIIHTVLTRFSPKLLNLLTGGRS